MHFIIVSLDKAFHFLGKFHVLVKTITDSVRLGVLNEVLRTANGVIFCEMYLQTAVHNDITTIHDIFKIFLISSFFDRSSISDPRSSILVSLDRSFAH